MLGVLSERLMWDLRWITLIFVHDVLDRCRSTFSMLELLITFLCYLGICAALAFETQNETNLRFVVVHFAHHFQCEIFCRESQSGVMTVHEREHSWRRCREGFLRRCTRSDIVRIVVAWIYHNRVCCCWGWWMMSRRKSEEIVEEKSCRTETGLKYCGSWLRTSR